MVASARQADFAAKERTERKRGLGVDVLTAAKERIAWTFDTFPRIYMSGPSGKDSGAMMHLVCEEARRRGRKVGVLYVDLEAQYEATIEFVQRMFAEYADVIEPYWLCLPIHLRNAASFVQPQWIAWDPTCPEQWVRQPPKHAITDVDRFPWYTKPWRDGDRWAAMEFEELIDDFGHWYAGELACACLVGIRSDESLNRWRTIASVGKSRFEGRCYTTYKGQKLFNVYPIYDWANEDVWTYFGRTGHAYPRTYDLMHAAGVPISKQRICQPYGDDQRQGLDLFAVLEPKTWPKIVARVNGANMGALYARTRGSIMGNGAPKLPEGHTWQSFTEFLLDTLPESEAENYRNKFAVFVSWWRTKGWPEIPDEADPKLEAAKKAPSWRRMARAVLRNDHACKSLSFAPQRATEQAYKRYRKLARKRRAEWGIFDV